MADNILTKDRADVDVDIAAKEIGGVKFPRNILTTAAGADLDPAIKAYVDGLFANILQAQRLQEQARQLALIAKADQEAAEAREMLALAIEAERIAQQEMQDFDIVFVATVLAHA